MVRRLRENGVTIVLTTHYIVEAEEMADRVGVINKGEIILVEDKGELMRKLGSKQLTLQLAETLDEVPAALAGYGLELSPDGGELVYTYDSQAERMEIADLLADLGAAGVRFRDLQTKQSSLEEIFVDLVKEAAMNFHAITRNLQVRDGEDLPHAASEHRLARHLDLAVLRGLRRGDRLAHRERGGGRLRLVHRARPHHADPAHPEHLQRVLRHLLPQVHRHHLRVALGTGLLRRDHHRLRRGRGYQIR